MPLLPLVNIFLDFAGFVCYIYIMNIFYLDENLETCAKYHVDKHIVKMPLEAAQLIATTLWVDKLFGFTPRALNSDENAVIREAKAKEPLIDERTFTRYLPTHINHPCAIWSRNSADNFEWLFSYLLAISDEYTYRYGKTHAALTASLRTPNPVSLVHRGITERPQCMPDEYKVKNNPVQAYRNYYIGDKNRLAGWKHREPPAWWETLGELND